MGPVRSSDLPKVTCQRACDYKWVHSQLELQYCSHYIQISVQGVKWKMKSYVGNSWLFITIKTCKWPELKDWARLTNYLKWDVCCLSIKYFTKEKETINFTYLLKWDFCIFKIEKLSNLSRMLVGSSLNILLKNENHYFSVPFFETSGFFK